MGVHQRHKLRLAQRDLADPLGSGDGAAATAVRKAQPIGTEAAPGPLVKTPDRVNTAFTNGQPTEAGFNPLTERV